MILLVVLLQEHISFCCIFWQFPKHWQTSLCHKWLATKCVTFELERVYQSLAGLLKRILLQVQRQPYSPTNVWQGVQVVRGAAKAKFLALACLSSEYLQLKEGRLLCGSKGDLERRLLSMDVMIQDSRPNYHGSKSAWHLHCSPCLSVCLSMFVAGPMCTVTSVVCSFTASLPEPRQAHIYRFS